MPSPEAAPGARSVKGERLAARMGKLKDYKAVSDLLGLMSSPTRLRILDMLKDGVKCVSDIEGFLGLRQPNISQHLSMLRRAGVVDYYVDGKLRCYFLKDPRVLGVLGVLGRRYPAGLPAPSCCPSRRGASAAKEAVRGKRAAAAKGKR